MKYKMLLIFSNMYVRFNNNKKQKQEENTIPFELLLVLFVNGNTN